MDEETKVTVPAQEKITRHAWRTLAILSCLGLIVMFAETMVLPAIPDFIRDFSISYNTSSWVLSSYLIAGAVMTPIAGKLSDTYGKKKILLIVMAVYSAGILAAGFANSFEFLLAARVAQGVGFSMFPIAFAMIREIFPESRLGVAQSIFSSTFGGGAVVGLLVGASIIQYYGWHATFFTVFPVAAVLALVIVRFIRAERVSLPPQVSDNVAEKDGTKPPVAPLDLKGALALSVTIISFLAGISYLENSIQSAGLEAIGLFAAAAASLAALIVIEKRSQYPLIDLKLITQKTLLSAIVILLIVGLCTFMIYQTIPIMVRSPQPLGFGGNVISVAAIQLPFMAIIMVGMVTSGFVVARIGNRRLTAIGTIISAIGFFSLLLFHSTEFMVTVTLAIISAGLSLAFTGGFNIVLMSAPIHATGIALGMTVLLNLIGQAVGPSLAAIYQQMYRGTVAGVPGDFPTADAYNLIFATAAIISLAAVGFSIALYRSRAPPQTIIPDAASSSVQEQG